MTTAVKLAKKQWQPYFDRVSKVLTDEPAEVEATALPIGVQAVAEWLPILGIVYDRKNDLIEIAFEEIDHMIAAPKEIYVDEGPMGLESVEIVGRDGIRHIVQLRNPLLLPAPEAMH